MPIIYNGKTLDAIKYNGTTLDKVVYNGVVVWENWVYKTTEISKSISSDAGGWNTEYTYNSGWITLSKPIKNPTVYIYNEGHDCSTSTGYFDVQYEDGTTATVASCTSAYSGSYSTKTSSKTTTLSNNLTITAYRVRGLHKCFSGYSSNTGKITAYYQKGS